MAQSTAAVLNDATAIQYLKDWLASELEPLCDAEPAVLADYVIALIKNGKPRDEMRVLCISQLEDFLSEYTAPFVDNLLNMMDTLDFLPREVRQKFIPDTSHQYNQSQNTYSSSEHDRGRERTQRDDYTRARGRHDNDEVMGGTDSDRNSRRDRRHGSPTRDRNWTRSPTRRRSASPSSRMGRDTYRDGHGSYDDRRSQKRRDRLPPRQNQPRSIAGSTQGTSSTPVMSTGGPIPVWGATPNPLAGSVAGVGMPGMLAYPAVNYIPSGAPGARSGYRRGRCHQFDQKGYCSRGETCPYEHVPANTATGTPEVIGYSPENPGSLNGGADATDAFASARGRGGARMGRGRGRGGRGGGAFDTFNANASNATSRTILRVESISPEQCALDKINEYFRRFGTIVNIQVDPPNGQALVQFSSNAEAYSAYSCQDAVFGNRFVKVFWHEKLHNDSWQGDETGNEGASDSLANPESEADVKARQRQAKLEQILDIQRKKEQLLQMQLEQQQLLESQLSRSDLNDNDRAELQQALDKMAATVRESQAETEHLRTQQQEAINNANLTTEQLQRKQLDNELDNMQRESELSNNNAIAQEGEPESEEAMLRAKLAKLQKEAEEWAGGYYGRGRGRGSYGGWRGRGRGRGSMTWTPSMASGAAAPAAPTTFRLDNRTTKIQVRDLTDDIKEIWFYIGHRYHDAENRAIVTFEARHEAERAAFGGAQMEGVGTLKMSWYNESAPAQPTPEAAAPSTNAAMDEDGDFDAMEDSERSWKR
ncbi:hypothetical protein BDF19DRAFT_424356 [Syncephalis fuscata]|nr:hypothetical protein BDF19DRAFT_424356 [Syncephalis fuscata]